jgi:hypothetical protein
MGFSISTIFILAGLAAVGAAVVRAVNVAQRKVSPVKIMVRPERSRRPEGKRYE